MRFLVLFLATAVTAWASAPDCERWLDSDGVELSGEYRALVRQLHISEVVESPRVSLPQLKFDPSPVFNNIDGQNNVHMLIEIPDQVALRDKLESLNFILEKKEKSAEATRFLKTGQVLGFRAKGDAPMSDSQFGMAKEGLERAVNLALREIHGYANLTDGELATLHAKILDATSALLSSLNISHRMIVRRQASEFASGGLKPEDIQIEVLDRRGRVVGLYDPVQVLTKIRAERASSMKKSESNTAALEAIEELAKMEKAEEQLETSRQRIIARLQKELRKLQNGTKTTQPYGIKDRRRALRDILHEAQNVELHVEEMTADHYVVSFTNKTTGRVKLRNISTQQVDLPSLL